MAKGPTKKAAKKPVRPASKAVVKPSVKSKAPVAKTKAPIPVAKPSKPAPLPQRFAALPAPPAPAPISTIKSPSADALSVFERGMHALQRHDYKVAATAFKELVNQFPSEGFLTDRGRVYLELAERELSKRPTDDGSIEERLTAATHALNNHNDVEAARIAADVLSDDRSQDLAEYLLAVVASRGGDVETALAHLRNAISLNPECRLQARQDEEFDPLMESDDFHALIEAPAATSTLATPGGPVAPRRPVRKTGR